jgi:hypothetical protein
MSTLIQRNFSGGEIGPSLYSRVDTVKYATAVRKMRNLFIMRHGGATSRPGTELVGAVFDSTKRVRLIPFVFNTEQTYMLEFGEEVMRVIQDGAYLINIRTITNISKAASAVVTVGTGHSFYVGDVVSFSGVVGMTQINGLTGTVSAKNTTQITVNINSSGFSNYASGGTATGEEYRIDTDYQEEDLQEIQFVQSADVITLVHPNYPPQELSRTASTTWTLSSILVEPETVRPTSGTGSGTGGASSYRYRVTAVSSKFEESLPGWENSKAISAVTNATPVVITTSASHGYTDGDEVRISIFTSTDNQELNEYWTINVLTATTFELTGSTTVSGLGSLLSGFAFRSYIRVDSVAAPTPSAPITLTNFQNGFDTEYNVYKELNGAYGFIGIASTTDPSNVPPVFLDIGYTPDTTDSHPVDNSPFEDAGNYPSTVSYVQQRRTFANTDNMPETVFMSRIGFFDNFTTSQPIQSDDAVTFSMVGRQVNSVRHLVELAKLVIFTETGEWVVEGGADGTITPFEVNPKQHSYNGASRLAPIVIDNTALFVQARGGVVRDLGFEIQSDGYRGNDLTIFASHLFDGYTLQDWAYQKIPHSVVWSVRSDGILVALTYVREQQIFGWHRHDTDGEFENVAVIPEGDQDAVYVVVKRNINGTDVRYVERLTNRLITDIVDYIGMDCAITRDGRNTAATTMTLSGGTTWAYDETITLTASASFFTSGMVDDQIQLTGADGELIRFTINTYSSATVVTGKPNRTVPASLRTTATAEWAHAVTTITGLSHLEGKEVAVFADGFVVGNPYNESYDVLTVTGGQIELSEPYAVVHVGLPYLCDLETLDIDTSQGETIVDKKKLTQQVTLQVEATRGLFAGPKPPEENSRNTMDDPTFDLYELKIRETESMDEPVSLTTKQVTVNIAGEWNSNGRVFIRQLDPLPITILAIAPTGLFPFK